MRLSYLSGLAVAAAASSALAQPYLLIPDWTGDRVMLFSATDGSLIDPNYISEINFGDIMQSPKKAIRVGGEILVVDALADKVLRFSLDGQSYLGDLITLETSGLDNARSITLINNHLYIPCGSGTFAGQIAIFDLAGNVTGFFDVLTDVDSRSPFDVIEYNGRVLVTDSQGDHITSYNYDGSDPRYFYRNPRIGTMAFPEQMHIDPSDGSLLVAGFSLPDGVFRFSASGGQIAYYDPQSGFGGPRTACPLDNGLILMTNGSTVATLNPANNQTIVFFGGVNAQYATRVESLACPADFNADGFVDFFDFDDFVLCFEGDVCPPGKSPDFNNDGFVDFFDFDDFVVAFERGC
jgi:hypothetical protein